ncbi:MAG: hypothetical protein IPP19_08390 [Verrucomicrobia bacterium]|nr:hypothetical protein [Verrucomicrobiota bacterium]
MSKISLGKDGLIKSASGLGPLTREKVRVRARALASLQGRPPIDVSQMDYEQAKRELTGLSGLAQQEAMLDLPSTSAATLSAPSVGRSSPHKPPLAKK